MKIRNAVCYSFSLSGEDPMAHLRLIGPLRQSGIDIIKGVENGQIVVGRVSEADIIIIQRELPKKFDDYKKIVEFARKEGKPLVFDLDDLLFFLPENHPDRLDSYYGSSLLPMLQALMEVDLVSVATPRLRDFVINYNNNVSVLPNYFDDNLWRLKPPVLKTSEHETLTIGYMGGNSHKPDLEYITPVLLDLIKRYSQKLRFQFWGIQPPAEVASLTQVQRSPTTTYRYKDFATFFQAQTADIFIAPLIDTLFNRCKSPIKFFEYSALGVPGVFSRLETYADVVTHGQNGLLATSLDEWTDCLIQLIEDKELRFYLAKNAQKTIRENWLLSRNAFRWNETFESAVDIVSSNREQNRDIVSIVKSINFQLFETFNKKEVAVQTLMAQVAEKEQALQALSAQVAEREAQVQALNAYLAEIKGSRAWKLIQVLWRIRTTFMPHGSRRERLAGLVRRSLNILGTEKLTALIRSAVKFSRRKTTGSTDLPLPAIPAIDKSIFDNLDLSTKKVIRAFSNKPVNDPDVSIVIPVYNHLDDTLRCLLSVAMTNEKTKFEIIVADDASTDGTRSLITRCQGLRYIRNEQNLGFLRNCNRAAATARGKYIMFLNNDVIVLPHWLDTIIDTFSNFPSAGLVGSKLLYPDGTLQEAGGVIWSDGTGLNYGRKDDPRKPEYNYLREVDYCSGASIVIPRSLWEQLGGFDELFTPAYYEDTDLAFRVRQARYSVIYQPLSQVFHVEGTTSGTDVNAGIKHYQEVNRHKFVERWKNAIRGYGVRESTEEFSYRNHYRKRFALFIDACTLTPDQDSGSIDAFNFLRMLRGLGFEVSFIPATNLLYFGRYTQDLQGIGIECQYAPFIRSVEDFLKDEGKRFDLVFLSRAPTAAKYIDMVRQYSPRARIVFNTVDLHFLREERAAALGDSKASFEQAREAREQEISVMRKADQTILVSEFEYKVVRDCAPEVKATVIPLPREIPGRSTGFEGRSDVLFLGGYNHLPNVDAVFFFVNKIWPLIKKQVPACRFLIAGSNMPKKVRKLGRKGDIVILGHVSDLDGLYSRCKLSVAPLRYGAGVKGKVVTSLGFGVPCVATSMAAEGMELKDGIHVLVADTPEEFAEAVVRVYNSTELWEKLSQNGLAFVQERFSVDRVQSKFCKMLKDMRLVM